MESCFYDLHIHSALSPCADEDMTPNNIVNMALLKGLDVIAITDHNSCGNCGAAMAAARRTGLIVLPGMELCTAEEIHVLCLFSALEGAVSFWRIVEASTPAFPNRAEIFGHQLYFDSSDRITGEEPRLLTAASGIGVDRVTELVKCFGGIAIPAHIDRPSFSVTSVLGTLPVELGFSSVEVSRPGAAEELLPAGKNAVRILVNSDAHTLGAISERLNSVCITEKNRTKFIKNFL